MAQGDIHWSKNPVLREETIRKFSASLKGREGWNKGLTKETDERVNRIAKTHSDVKKQMFKEGRLNGLYTSEIGRGREKTYFKEGHEVYWTNLKNRKSHNELYLEELMIKHNFPYRFVGDGSVIFDRINPDFINTNGQKKVIELHGGGKLREWGVNRDKIFEKYGYSWIVIDTRYLRQNPDKVIEKIRCFDES